MAVTPPAGFHQVDYGTNKAGTGTGKNGEVMFKKDDSDITILEVNEGNKTVAIEFDDNHVIGYADNIDPNNSSGWKFVEGTTGSNGQPDNQALDAINRAKDAKNQANAQQQQTQQTQQTQPQSQQPQPTANVNTQQALQNLTGNQKAWDMAAQYSGNQAGGAVTEEGLKKMAALDPNSPEWAKYGVASTDIQTVKTAVTQIANDSSALSALKAAPGGMTKDNCTYYATNGKAPVSGSGGSANSTNTSNDKVKQPTNAQEAAALFGNDDGWRLLSSMSPGGKVTSDSVSTLAQLPDSDSKWGTMSANDKAAYKKAAGMLQNDAKAKQQLFTDRSYVTQDDFKTFGTKGTLDKPVADSPQTSTTPTTTTASTTSDALNRLTSSDKAWAVACKLSKTSDGKSINSVGMKAMSELSEDAPEWKDAGITDKAEIKSYKEAAGVIFKDQKAIASIAGGTPTMTKENCMLYAKVPGKVPTEDEVYSTLSDDKVWTIAVAQSGTKDNTVNRTGLMKMVDLPDSDPAWKGMTADQIQMAKASANKLLGDFGALKKLEGGNGAITQTAMKTHGTTLSGDPQPKEDTSESTVLTLSEQSDFIQSWNNRPENKKGNNTIHAATDSDTPNVKDIEGGSYEVGKGYVVVKDKVYFDSADKDSAQHRNYKNAFDAAQKWNMINGTTPTGLTSSQMDSFGLTPGQDMRGLLRRDNNFPENCIQSPVQTEAMQKQGLIIFTDSVNGKTILVSKDISPEAYANALKVLNKGNSGSSQASTTPGVLSSSEQSNFIQSWNNRPENKKGNKTIHEAKDSDIPNFKDIEGGSYEVGQGYVVIKDKVYFDSADKDSAQHHNYQYALEAAQKWNMINGTAPTGLTSTQMDSFDLKPGQDMRDLLLRDEHKLAAEDIKSPVQTEAMQKQGLIICTDSATDTTIIISKDKTPDAYANALKILNKGNSGSSQASTTPGVLSSSEQSNFIQSWNNRPENKKGNKTIHEAKDSDIPNFKDIEGGSYEVGQGYVVIKDKVYFDSADKDSAQHRNYKNAFDAAQKWNMINGTTPTGLTSTQMDSFDLKPGQDMRDLLLRDERKLDANEIQSPIQTDAMQKQGLIICTDSTTGKTVIISNDKTPDAYANAVKVLNKTRR